MVSLRATVALTCLLSISFITACGKPTLNVNLHGINYSGETFSYAVADPATPDLASGGELIDPFGAGGTTCCVVLPKNWQPGIKLQVRTTYWREDRLTGNIAEFKGALIVEVPRYADGKPGELWIVREADGGVSVVSSDFQPDHSKWPGKVKGWPVPSLAYRRERWELHRNHEQGQVELFLSLLKQVEEEPQVRSKEAWEYAMQNNASETQGYLGPDDPQYIAFLRKNYKQGLEQSRTRLAKIIKERP